MSAPATPDKDQPSATEPSQEGTPAQGLEKAKALLRASGREMQAATRETGQQLGRVYRYSREYAQQLNQQRQTREILSRLGQRLFDLGLGDPTLREQFSQINERILNLQAAKSSTRRLEAERRGLQIRLAESVLQEPAPPQVAEEYDQAAQAAATERGRKERLAQQRSLLLPPDRTSRLRVGAGLATLVLALIVVLWLAKPYLGLGPSLGPRAGELLGTWTGTHQISIVGMTFKAGYTLQFRRDGRVRWEEKMLEDATGMTDYAKKMLGDTSQNDVGTGRWAVDHVEGNVFSVRVISDLEPDETKAFGWRINLEDPNQMTLVNFTDVPIKLSRK